MQHLSRSRAHRPSRQERSATPVQHACRPPEEVCGKSQEDLDRDWMTANPYACRFCDQRFPAERGKGGMENHIYPNHSELLEAEAEDWHAFFWQ